jgi:hypothetical protein
MCDQPEWMWHMRVFARLWRRQQQTQDLIITLKEIIKDMQTGDANIAAFNTLIFRKETHSWASTMAPPARSADQLHAAAILGHHG